MPDVTPATPGQAATDDDRAQALYDVYAGTLTAAGAVVYSWQLLSGPYQAAWRAVARADRDRLAAENASLRQQLLRTEEQCRRHVNQADAECARWKAERDAAREELGRLQQDLADHRASIAALREREGTRTAALIRIARKEITLTSSHAVRDIARAALAGDAPRHAPGDGEDPDGLEPIVITRDDLAAPAERDLARAVAAEMLAHIASGDDYADPVKLADWRRRAGLEGA